MEKWEERYHMEKILGKGGNATVYLVYDKKLNMHWAMKEMKANMEKETEILCKISHPAFPRVVDQFSKDNYCYLIMDYIRGVPIMEYISRGQTRQNEICQFALQIAEALSYLHHMNPPIYYLDCKPQNIMVTETGKIKMIDLGSSYYDLGEESKQRISGTRYYAPVEQIGLMGTDRIITKQCDIYSFGMTICTMLTRKEQIGRDRHGRLKIRPLYPTLLPGLEHILERCTRIDRKTRYHTMEEVIRDFNRIDKLNGKYKRRGVLYRFCYYFSQLVCIWNVLTLARKYTQESSPLLLTEMIVFFCAFLVIGMRKKEGICQVNKEVIKGKGKRILS